MVVCQLLGGKLNLRKSLWVILAVLVVAIGAPAAHADSTTDGTLNFTLTSGTTIPTGSFVFDNGTDTLTSYTLDWNGAEIDATSTFASVPLATLEGSGTWSAFMLDHIASFTITLPGDAPTILAGTTPGPIVSAAGTFSVTAATTVPTPEPSSIALMLLGVGLVFVMRKCIGQRLPQVS